MERIFWAECSVVMDDFSLERHGIAWENFGNESIYKLVMFVDVRVTLHEHSGDHEGQTNDSTGITSSFHVDLRNARRCYARADQVGAASESKGSDSQFGVTT